MTSLNQKITKSLLKIPANQLTEVEVKAISLVTHGANQAPFKILKSEDIESQQTEEVNMFNLGDLFTRSKSNDEPAVPTVDAVIIQKDGKNVEALKEAIKAEGFSIDNVEERDGALVLKQVDEVDIDKLKMYKSNADIVIGVANITKAFDPWSSTTNFSENLKKNSFLPGLHLASQVMQETAFEILVSADKAEDFKELLEKSASDFAAHIVSLASNIPAAAFKLEGIKIVDKVVAEPTVKNVDTKDEAKVEDKAPVVAAKDEAVKADASVKDPAPVDTDGGDENMGIGNMMDTPTEKLTKAVQSMEAKFTESSDKLAESVKAIGDRLGQLETDTKAMAKKSEEDLNNVVLGAGINPDQASQETVVDVLKGNDKAEYPEELWENAIQT